MDDTMLGGLIGGTVMVLGGLLILWTGSRMARGRFRRNRWAGIRTPATMRSDEAWEVAHETAAPLMSAAGTFGAVGGLTGIIAAGMDGSQGTVAGLILGGAGLMVILLVAATARGDRAARRVE